MRPLDSPHFNKDGGFCDGGFLFEYSPAGGIEFSLGGTFEFRRGNRYRFIYEPRMKNDWYWIWER